MQCSVENVSSTVALKFTKLRDPNDQNSRLGDCENYGKPEISNAEYSRLGEHFPRRIIKWINFDTHLKQACQPRHYQASYISSCS